MVDVGTGIGDFALFAAQVDNTRILAFEPFPESFALLSENQILNEVSNVEVYSETVGEEGGIQHLVTTGRESLKTRSHHDPLADISTQTQVRARPLLEIFDSHLLESFDLLKMDCEGCEYDVLMVSPVESLLKKSGSFWNTMINTHHTSMRSCMIFF